MSITYQNFVKEMVSTSKYFNYNFIEKKRVTEKKYFIDIINKTKDGI